MSSGRGAMLALPSFRICDIEMIRMDQINEAFDRVVAGDVKYRFVIDMQSLPEAA